MAGSSAPRPAVALGPLPLIDVETQPLPSVGEQLLDPPGRVGADAIQDVPEIGERVDAEAPARRRHAEEDGRGPATALAPGEQPIAASEGHRLDRTLGGVVVDLEITGF